MDLFLAYAHQDRPFAQGLATTLSARGLEIGSPVELWPHMRLLPRIDQGLTACRYALVVLSAEFLKLHYPPKDLDGLAGRSKVVPVLFDVNEAELAEQSSRLAVAAIPGSMIEHLVRLLRPDSSAGADD